MRCVLLYDSDSGNRHVFRCRYCDRTVASRYGDPSRITRSCIAGPTDVERLANFGKATWQHLRHGAPRATQQQIDVRLAICRECEYFDGQACRKCGCRVSSSAKFLNKLAWADQRCPIGKWQESYVEDAVNTAKRLWLLCESRVAGQGTADPNRAVVTAADAGYFPYLQAFTNSLRLSQPATRLLVFDLGLTDEQRQWLADQQAELPPLPELEIGRDVEMWQTWNKPLLIAAADVPQVLWIDADCLVIRPLAPLWQAIDQQPLICRCLLCNRERMNTYNHECLNAGELYNGVQRSDIIANAGVVGFDLRRDARLLRQWIENVRRAADDATFRGRLRWWDQGALMLALDQLRMADILQDQRGWNDTLTPLDCEDMGQVVEAAKHTVRPSVVLHFAGKRKPFVWSDSKAAKPEVRLTVLALGHHPDPPTSMAERSYIHYVDLSALPIGEHQHNSLAENRIYLSNEIQLTTTPYVGLGTAHWNEKYPNSKIDMLAELPLDPGTVYAPLVATPGWHVSCATWHPDSEWLTQRLAEMTGINPLVNMVDVGGQQKIHLAESIWSNNWIASREVALDLVQFWREHFLALWREFFPKYGYDFPIHNRLEGYPHWSGKANPANGRTWAYVGERITLFYFASRHDLRLVQL